LILWIIFASKLEQTVNTNKRGTATKKRRKSLKVNHQKTSQLTGAENNTLVVIECGQGNPELETLLSVRDFLCLQINLKD
jgi:DNA-binding XRE family transcriptional regulator